MDANGFSASAVCSNSSSTTLVMSNTVSMLAKALPVAGRYHRQPWWSYQCDQYVTSGLRPALHRASWSMQFPDTLLFLMLSTLTV